MFKVVNEMPLLPSSPNRVTDQRIEDRVVMLVNGFFLRVIHNGNLGYNILTFTVSIAPRVHLHAGKQQDGYYYYFPIHFHSLISRVLTDEQNGTRLLFADDVEEWVVGPK